MVENGYMKKDPPFDDCSTGGSVVQSSSVDVLPHHHRCQSCRLSVFFLIDARFGAKDRFAEQQGAWCAPRYLAEEVFWVGCWQYYDARHLLVLQVHPGAYVRQCSCELVFEDLHHDVRAREATPSPALRDQQVEVVSQEGVLLSLLLFPFPVSSSRLLDVALFSLHLLGQSIAHAHVEVHAASQCPGGAVVLLCAFLLPCWLRAVCHFLA